MDDKYIGMRLEGRYELVELIGEGGMANVYRGRDLLEKRTVAVKILKDEFLNNAELVRRFKNESRAISVLNHPNIVKVYDLSVDDKMQYIVMEHLQGITLKEYIEQRGEPLTYKESIHFVSQVLRALQHAHDKGIVHRDIKPQNIMLTEDGNVKVMDFGIARLSRSESHTQTDQAIGSVHYISPEQARGEATDSRADIYSTGIMLYEMLTGILPFESDNAVSIAIKQISDEAIPVRRVNPSVPEGLEAITMKAMAKDPRHRYQDALEMLRDIEEFKRNPSIKFEYEYLTGQDPARNVQVASKQKQGKTATKSRKTKKLRKSMVVPIVGGITIAIVAVCAILIIAIFQNSATPLFGAVEEVELPDFVGMQWSEVQEVLASEEYRNLRIEPKEVYNVEKPANEVISQNPTPKMIKANQRVVFQIASGVKNIVIPDVTGKTRAEASKIISDEGLVPYVKTVYDSGVEMGLVIDTVPPIGSAIPNKPGENVVTINISGRRLAEPRNVPNLIGLESVEAARALLAQYDLELLSAYKEEESDAPAGSIIGQNPPEGTSVTVYSGIQVTVAVPRPSGGDAAGGVPGVIGIPEADARAALEGAGLNVVSVNYVENGNPGIVSNQNPGPGSPIPEDKSVYLEVGVGAAQPPVTENPTENPQPEGGGEQPTG